MPVIAITPCRKPRDYDAAIRRAGGTPRALSLDEAAARALDGVDGLLLTGGDDVNPALYGETPHRSFEAAEPGRDTFEVDVIRHALERDLPVLAICRGLQVLNVTLGGTLIQDIPSEPAPHLAHDADGPTTLAHIVDVAPGSRLATLVGPDAIRAVNSRHHQSVRALGDGLVVAAVAPDGIIEAAERPDSRFCVGVQWHPENFWASGEFDTLFDEFVRACGGRPEGGSGLRDRSGGQA